MVLLEAAVAAGYSGVSSEAVGGRDNGGDGCHGAAGRGRGWMGLLILRPSSILSPFGKASDSMSPQGTSRVTMTHCNLFH